LFLLWDFENSIILPLLSALTMSIRLEKHWLQNWFGGQTF
jgi:hypothetical protein